MALIVSLLIFGFVITVHEFGHYITAVKSGVLVEEFAIGMGPIIWKKQGKETLFTLRVFPIGGFCQMLGEDEDDRSERSFNSKSVWKRIIVISGGVMMNIIIAFIIFFGFNAYSGFTEPVVKTTLEGYPADIAGLEPNDRIYSVDGYKISTQSELSLRISQASSNDIKKGEDPIIDLVYVRDGEKIETELPLQLDTMTNRYILGFNVSGKTGIFGKEVEGYDKATLLETIKASYNDMFFVVESTIYGITQLFTTPDALSQVAGPIGIVDAIGDTYDQSVETGGFSMAFYNMIWIMGLISANLAVFNLLPIPALDGGRLVFLFIEAITGKQVPPDKEGMIHFIGFVVLIGFALVVAFSDIYKLF